MAKKKKKSELVLVGALVPKAIAEALKVTARNDRRTVSNVIRSLIEDSPQIRHAVQQGQRAA